EGIEYRLLPRLEVDCAESLLAEYQSAMLDTSLVVNEGGFGYVPTLPALPPVQFCPPFLVRQEFGQQLLYLGCSKSGIPAALKRELNPIIESISGIDSMAAFKLRQFVVSSGRLCKNLFA